MLKIKWNVSPLSLDNLSKAFKNSLILITSNTYLAMDKLAKTRTRNLDKKNTPNSGITIWGPGKVQYTI
jgi:hypothetical protein